MPKLAANLSMLFNELPFLDRFEAAANAGFHGVEYLFPYDFDAIEIKQRLTQFGLTQVLFNLPAGNWEEGDRGIAVDPGRVEEFRAGVPEAVSCAKALNCSQVNCLAGIVPAGVSEEVANDTFVANLKFAAEALAAEGISLVIEAINTRDIPGFFLNNTSQALDVLEQVGSNNLKLQYDIYHMQIMEGDIATTVSREFEHIQHVQLADNPGRHEPGTGEINYAYMFKHLDELGYQGWVGCEYKPKTTTEAGLHWLKDFNQI
ncbi:hydroxypyruvate isomerase [Photobacterium proteolyticum]|uniref:Hydroxypyruvate isomerase n=1 Tax=Photobacterium proteolyticum TaxID=1903952 RepID=A0A1Q9H1J2_9GAMM|nr:hydroxypyruvate isomerase [Photobacterium proteolyticum]OLQ81375.1 hydroxypyruvate isomerase [Photobacterium proteolyticum]